MNDTEFETEETDIKPPPLYNRILTFLLFSRRGLAVLVLVALLAVLMAILPTGTRLTLLSSLYRQRGLLILLFLFSLLMLSLLFSAGQSMDIWLFSYINRLWKTRRKLELFMFAITQVGNGLFSFIVVGIFYALGQRRIALELLIGTLSLWIVVEILKMITERARPFLINEEVRVVGWRERGKSFPSGHSAQTFFMASLLSHHMQSVPFLPLVFYSIAILVGVSRVFIGVHYPRDVLAGAILGSVWGILLVLIQAYWVAIW